ncbi:MAG: hypothetical protein AMJ54_03035 [Deltaproteobacteria bacterium SG8_13]|nr:MAG: hypothetical protein AMJ54_03035 [Deltaproteobacteria bacterium SG8_13]
MAAGCWSGENRSVGVYVLLNVAENHSRNLSQDIDTARQAVDFLLQTLAPADTLAVASIATVGFSESDIIATTTFGRRPSVVNDQKRSFRFRFDRFAQRAVGSPYSDLSGGLLQAIESLNRSGTDHKTILILSDLKEKPTTDPARDLPIQMTGFNVVTLKVPGFQPDARYMKLYRRRLENLRRKVESGNARFMIIDDLQQLTDVLTADSRAEGT